MRTTLFLTALMMTIAALPLTASAGEHEGCSNRETPCDDVNVGEMSCMPPEGAARTLSFVVGSRDQGKFRLQAVGVNHIDSGAVCEFVIHVNPSSIRFNEGFAPGILAPYGGMGQPVPKPCQTIPGEACVTETTFTWWRATHGVTFDVPFLLLVNGMPVAEGRVHFYDPVGYEDVMGGATVVSW